MARSGDNTPQGKLARGCLGVIIAIFAIPLVIMLGDIAGHIGCWQLGYSESPMAACPKWECGWFRICR